MSKNKKNNPRDFSEGFSKQKNHTCTFLLTHQLLQSSKKGRKKSWFQSELDKSSHQRRSLKKRPAVLLKRDPNMFFCEICGIFKNTYLLEHIKRTASDSAAIISDIKISLVL